MTDRAQNTSLQEGRPWLSGTRPSPTHWGQLRISQPWWLCSFFALSFLSISVGQCNTFWKMHYIHSVLKHQPNLTFSLVLGRLLWKNPRLLIFWVLMTDFKSLFCLPTLTCHLSAGYIPAPLVVYSLMLLVCCEFWILIITSHRIVFKGKWSEELVTF